MTSLARARLERTRPVVVQWLRFATVGVANTVLSLGLYAALLDLRTFYLAASAIAFLVATCNSYALNRRWTFRSDGSRVVEIVRFFVVSAGGLGVNLAALYLLVDAASARRFAAELLVIPLVSVLTFGWNRRWTFRAAYVADAPGARARRPMTAS